MTNAIRAGVYLVVAFLLAGPCAAALADLSPHHLYKSNLTHAEVACVQVEPPEVQVLADCGAYTIDFVVTPDYVRVSICRKDLPKGDCVIMFRSNLLD